MIGNALACSSQLAARSSGIRSISILFARHLRSDAGEDLVDPSSKCIRGRQSYDALCKAIHSKDGSLSNMEWRKHLFAFDPSEVFGHVGFGVVQIDRRVSERCSDGSWADGEEVDLGTGLC